VLPTLEGFWVIDTGCLEETLALLRGVGWRAAPWDELVHVGRLMLPKPAAYDLAFGLPYVGYKRPIETRVDAAFATCAA
jgi:hypothetical protein